VPGFFAAAALATDSRVTADSLPLCGSCGLSEKCESPKMEPSGKGGKGILIVGEGPTGADDSQGAHFSGPAGKLLRSQLRRLDVDLDRDCWLTNAIICRPAHENGKNRKPTDKEILYCRPNLLKTIRDLEPKTIVLLGGLATKSLIGHLELDGAGDISMWAGWQIPSLDFNSWICPTWHPNYLMGDENKNPAMELWWNRHLEAATKLSEKPWRKSLPDYRSEVEIVYDVPRAVKVIERIIKENKPTAFDYETNMLKPDGPNARIVCASLCWMGKKTFAFPWRGDVAEAFVRFLRSPVSKIGANIKFEERWSMAVLGTRVRNWRFDTVQAAHILDNRKGITGVKFQAFVQLGLAPYNQNIEKFLQADGSRQENRIREADQDELLRYCGIDSLVEYRLAEIQSKKLGVEL